MDRFTVKALFVALSVVLFAATMWFVSGGTMSSVLFAAPIILGSEAVFMGLMYANLFLDGHEEEEAHEEEARHTKPVNWHSQPKHA